MKDAAGRNIVRPCDGRDCVQKVKVWQWRVNCCSPGAWDQKQKGGRHRIRGSEIKDGLVGWIVWVRSWCKQSRWYTTLLVYEDGIICLSTGLQGTTATEQRKDGCQCADVDVAGRSKLIASVRPNWLVMSTFLSSNHYSWQLSTNQDPCTWLQMLMKHALYYGDDLKACECASASQLHRLPITTPVSVPLIFLSDSNKLPGAPTWFLSLSQDFVQCSWRLPILLSTASPTLPASHSMFCPTQCHCLGVSTTAY